MQRRAAAAYVVLFLVIAAGAYAVIATAQAPPEMTEDPEYSVSAGQELTVDGRTYSVATANKSLGGSDPQVKLTWTNESAIWTADWDNTTSLQFATIETSGDGTTISFPQNRTETVPAPAGTNITGGEIAANRSAAIINYTDGTTNFTMTHVPMANATVVDVSAAEDGSHANVSFAPPEVETYELVEFSETELLFRERLSPDVRTVQDEGVTKVVVERDGTERLVPLSEYEPLERVRVDLTSPVTYRGNETEIAVNATAQTASLTWTAPRTEVVETGHAANVTLNGQTYFAYFTSETTLGLFEYPGAYHSYQSNLDTIDYFNERTNGLWAITLLSLIAAIMMVSMAYLPHKDTD